MARALGDSRARELERISELQASTDGQLREAREATRALSADFERYRGHSRKDNDEAERRGEDRALRALVEIFDNVERARLHEAVEAGPVAAGLQIIVDQFRRQLLRLGLERIGAERGAAFDPEVHEAVAHVEDDEVPEGTVVDEVTPGFRLRGRLFRPARVTIATRTYQS